MSKYIRKIVGNMAGLMILVVLAFLNWSKPLYMWFGDTPITRFIWLGLFFIILDIAFEIIASSINYMRLMTETMGFAKGMKKISKGFHVVSKFVLPNNLKADYVVVGSSGVWIVSVQDNHGKIMFSGDELIQDGIGMGGLITKSLERAYALSGFIKEKLGRDVKVAPVIAFSSAWADLSEMPKTVRGVFISSAKDTTSLIENTDFQLIDTKTIEEIYNIIKK